MNKLEQRFFCCAAIAALWCIAAAVCRPEYKEVSNAWGLFGVLFCAAAITCLSVMVFPPRK